MRPLLDILRLWRPQAHWLTLGGLISIAALAAGVTLMALSGATVSAAILAGALTAPLLLRISGVARVVLRYAERVVTHDATFRALAGLRVWFFRRLAVNSAGGLGYWKAGDVLSRLVGDVDSLDGLYLRVLLPLLGAVLLLPVLVICIGLHHAGLAAVVGLLFATAAFALPWRLERGAAESGAQLAHTSSAMRIAALDAITGLREVRAFGAEGRMLADVQAREASLLAAQRSLSRRAALAGGAALLCGQAAILAILIVVPDDPWSAVPLVFLSVAAFEAVAGLGRAGALAGHAATAGRRVLEAANRPAPVPDPASPAPLPPGSALAFEAVSFRWQPNRPAVFDGLTLEIPAGHRVAVLGPSGSGKSTLAALALKVAAPQSGRVRLGGVDLGMLAAADAHRRIGWLSQATHLFNDTIRGNLRLARPEADDAADDAALWQSLDAAQIGEMVRTLPDGLDTWVGEGGARFSGGQGRRLALARALLAPAPVLILDEPCAGLDAETERAFLATLNEVAGQRSVLLIAHRLTGVERLDRIYRLSGGRAVAAAA